MSNRNPSLERELALVALLDDPTPLVRERLLEEFRRLEGRGIDILRKVIRDQSGEVARSARRFLGELENNEEALHLIEFIRGMRYEMETGLLMINRVLNPGVKVVGVRKQLDALAQRCLELRVAPMTAREQCNLLNRVIFHEGGFRCNRMGGERPFHSCLEAVCERRVGQPLLLSAIYVLVGQRIGLELEPIALPGRFLVGCFYGAMPFYVDPLSSGRMREAVDLHEELNKHEALPDLCHLAPVPVGDVLRSCCQGLARQLELSQQFRLSRRFQEFVREFDSTYQRVRES